MIVAIVRVSARTFVYKRSNLGRGGRSRGRRFHQNGKQLYLLVNRGQEGITVSVKGSGQVEVLHPSTGEVSQVDLPAQLPMQGIRALMLICRL